MNIFIEWTDHPTKQVTVVSRRWILNFSLLERLAHRHQQQFLWVIVGIIGVDVGFVTWSIRWCLLGQSILSLLQFEQIRIPREISFP